MKRSQKRQVLSTLILTALFSACVTTGGIPRNKTNSADPVIKQLGKDAGAGHILLMQPLLDESAYASAWSLSAKLENLFEQAKKRKLLGPKTLVVLPANIGSWMSLFDQSTDVYQARSQQDALKLVFRADFFALLGAWIQSPVEDRVANAVFRQHSQKTANAYRKLMTKLAREYQVDLIAGSLLLPAPKISGGEIVVATKAALQRCAFVFSKKGELVGQPSCADELDASESRWIQPSGQNSALIYDTSIGRVALLQTWDAWKSERLREAKTQGAEYAVILQYLPVNKAWDQDWKNLSEDTQARLAVLAQNSPASSDSSHHFSDLFLRAGPPKMAQQAGFDEFAISFGHGRLWEQNLSGPALLQKGDQQILGPGDEAAGLVCLWLGEAPAPAPVVSDEKISDAKPETKVQQQQGQVKKKKKSRKKRRRRRRKSRRKKNH